MGKDLAFESHWQGLRTTCIVTWGSSLPVPEPHSLLRFLRGSETPEKLTPLCLTGVVSRAGWRCPGVRQTGRAPGTPAMKPRHSLPLPPTAGAGPGPPGRTPTRRDPFHKAPAGSTPSSLRLPWGHREQAENHCERTKLNADTCKPMRPRRGPRRRCSRAPGPAHSKP